MQRFRSILYTIKSCAIWQSRSQSSALSSTLIGTSNLLNRRLAEPVCIPCRLLRSKEVKQFYAQDGEYNPPTKDVIDRFQRLRWGAYIHPRSGRHKHVYRKSESIRRKLDDHILTNRATSFLLDNMLNRHWRRPRYYPDDIYEPYHKRTGVPWDYAQRKPKFFP
ncbi:hypothetical protein P879_01535 [Paragonimus westermani]|uniref:39S ribosomal protein L35, mitochondrial n=1 Tax=Paragonimus westermani TaxID=34504 RepID=A0A8T0DW11_9TREM|nr:hypothetical protein P879_01535 [Paragonimus westermani]